MGFVKPRGQEEGLTRFLKFSKIANGLFSDLSILVERIRYPGPFEWRPSEPVRRILTNIFLQGIIPPGGTIGYGMPDLIPAEAVVVVVVKDLPVADGVVSVVVEMAGKRDNPGCLFIGPA